MRGGKEEEVGLGSSKGNKSVREPELCRTLPPGGSRVASLGGLGGRTAFTLPHDFFTRFLLFMSMFENRIIFFFIVATFNFNFRDAKRPLNRNTHTHTH